jgi:hypothetical protein
VFDITSHHQQDIARIPADSVPATIEYDLGHYDATLVMISHGPCSIPHPDPPTEASSTFKRLIYRTLDCSADLDVIREAIQQSLLVITVDGSYDPITNKGSFSWIFESHKELLRGSQIISSPNKNACRAELFGMLAAILILEIIEATFPSISGSGTLYSDCQKGIRRAFRTGPLGIKDATQDEYDIILEIQRTRRQLRTTINPLWTPGHPTTTNSREEQVRNASAHALAVARLHNTTMTEADRFHFDPV